MPSYYAIVPAAGGGSRFGGGTPKQYRLLAGLRSLFAYKGQKKLIVFAVLFFVFAWGLDRLATQGLRFGDRGERGRGGERQEQGRDGLQQAFHEASLFSRDAGARMP